MATCKFCRKEITWLKEGRKNVPVEGDGSRHSCDEMKSSLDSLKVMDGRSLDPALKKKYEDAMNARVAAKKKPKKVTY